MIASAAWERLLVLGCAQTCEAPLPAVIDNINRVRARFAESRVLILENDSSDGTAALLQACRRRCVCQPARYLLRPLGPTASDPLPR